MTYKLKEYNCRGCFVIDYCFKNQKRKFYKIDLCPCRTCIVKGVCGKACNEYSILWRGAKRK